MRRSGTFAAALWLAAMPAAAEGLDWAQRASIGRALPEAGEPGWYLRTEWIGGNDGAGFSFGAEGWQGESRDFGLGLPVSLRAHAGGRLRFGAGAGFDLVHGDRVADRTGVGLLAPFALAEIGVDLGPVAVLAEGKAQYRWKSFGDGAEQALLGFGLALEVPYDFGDEAPDYEPSDRPDADPRYGAECRVGAPRTDENYDCPLPLGTGDPMNPWDDLFVWGFSMRTGWAPPSMGGLGFAVRRFFARAVGFELGADVFGGVDPDGERRTELPVALDALLFFHRGSFLQAYLLGGGGVSFARVQYDVEHVEHETWIGPRLGTGVQLKGARDLGWSFDVVGFARSPLAENASDDRIVAGALVRASGTIYPHD